MFSRLIKTMYSNTAVSHNPTIASVAAPKLNELEKARQACNAPNAAAMGSREPRVLKERRELCEVYAGMRAE